MRRRSVDAGAMQRRRKVSVGRMTSAQLCDPAKKSLQSEGVPTVRVLRLDRRQTWEGGLRWWLAV